MNNLIETNLDNNILAIKYPKESFKASSKIVVHEDQNVVMSNSNNDVFLVEEGCHKFSDIMNIGNDYEDYMFSYFQESRIYNNIELYYVSKLSKNIIFKQNGAIFAIDNIYDLHVKLYVDGVYNIQVEHSNILINSIQKMSKVLTTNKIADYFNNMLQFEIKNYINILIKDMDINVFKIIQYAKVIGRNIVKIVGPKFENCGLKLNSIDLNHWKIIPVI